MLGSGRGPAGSFLAEARGLHFGELGALLRWSLNRGVGQARFVQDAGVGGRGATSYFSAPSSPPSLKTNSRGWSLWPPFLCARIQEALVWSKRAAQGNEAELLCKGGAARGGRGLRSLPALAAARTVLQGSNCSAAAPFARLNPPLGEQQKARAGPDQAMGAQMI